MRFGLPGSLRNLKLSYRAKDTKAPIIKKKLNNRVGFPLFDVWVLSTFEKQESISLTLPTTIRQPRLLKQPHKVNYDDF